MRSRSVIGFLISLLFHFLLVVSVVWAVNDSEKVEHTLNGVVVDNPSTTLSMEMVMAMVQHELPPPEIEPEKIEQPKEEVPDPTVLEKKEQPKPDVEKKVEKKPKQKEPNKKKEQAKVKEKKVATYAPETVKSPDQANSNLSAGTKSTNQAVLGDGGASVDSYRHQLRSEIERHKRYSQRAKMLRHQGKVTVSFTLNNDGTISNIAILTSSGSAELDRLAVQAVNSARSVGPRPKGMSSQVSVPIDFKLR